MRPGRGWRDSGRWPDNRGWRDNGHRGRFGLIFRHRFQFVGIEMDADVDAIFCCAESECLPVHRDLTVAETEKSGEIDHRGLRLAGVVDQNIDDMSHGIALAIIHGLAEQTARVSLAHVLNFSRLRFGGIRFFR